MDLESVRDQHARTRGLTEHIRRIRVRRKNLFFHPRGIVDGLPPCLLLSMFAPRFMRRLGLLAFLAAALPVVAAPHEETVCSGDLSFRIVVKDATERNTVTITPSGLKNSNHPVSFECDGSLAKTILEDVNGDNIPELFLVLTGEGSGSYGEVKAFSTNGGKSLTDIVIAEPATADMRGYMGHDEFEVEENTFVRRFPVYKPGDTNAEPTGGWRQIQYKLEPGEAVWHLRIDRVTSY